MATQQFVGMAAMPLDRWNWDMGGHSSPANHLEHVLDRIMMNTITSD